MTADDIRGLITATGRSRPVLARMLGYGSENSLRQCQSGKQALPDDKTQWLAAYATFRTCLAKSEERWLKKNPPPNEKRG